MSGKTSHDGGRAFPGPHQSHQSVEIHEGMSLLDFYAGLAMQSLIATRQYDVKKYGADEAFAWARAMITARNGVK